MTNAYEEIRTMIENGDYMWSKLGEEWAGAGALVTANSNDSRLADTSLTTLCTTNAAALVWLIEAAKARADIDYLSKYEFYPRLVSSATNYIEEHGEGDTHAMLLATLEEIHEFFS